MKGALFSECLQHFPNHASSGDRKYLNGDIHAWHLTDAPKRAASAINIALMSLTTGTTHRLQRLDRFAFGALKSEARWLFGRLIGNHLATKRSKRHPLEDMLAASKLLSEARVTAAWQLDANEEEWDELE
jgi:hypothetical protein